MNIRNLSQGEIKRLLAASRVPQALVDACAADPRAGVRGLVEARDKRLAERARESRRLTRLYACEMAVVREHGLLVGGVDEVGRGPLAGPVVAACVVLPPRPRLAGLDDSKLVPAPQRAVLEGEIRTIALGIGVGVVEPDEIDAINIYQASLKAMTIAVAACSPSPPAYLLLDAVRLKNVDLPQEPIIGGDGKCACIAAASIIAKQIRDRLMAELDAVHPGYEFSVHKGYGTPLHLERLSKLGPSPIHRRSFAPVREWRSLGSLRAAAEQEASDAPGE